MKRLTILSVAYALAPVGPDAVGGAEQVLAALDRALVEAGHRSLVVSCRGSHVAGEWIDTGVDPGAAVDEAARNAAIAATRAAVAGVLAREHVDLVHAHGLDCAATLPAEGPPKLLTLHLPPDWYTSLRLRPCDRWHCVSAAQERAAEALWPAASGRLPFIGNGVPVERLGRDPHAKRRFALVLGRICPEKGQHFALQAAKSVDMPLLLGGTVFPYPDHQAYFAAEIAPLLDAQRRFLGPLAFARKRRLLSAAACLLVPSLAAETSSLVAMEAAACGTPVVAFPSGALSEIVEHGRSGFVVDGVAAMAKAIEAVAHLDPERCRAIARRRFALEPMIQAYLARYREMCGSTAAP